MKQIFLLTCLTVLTTEYVFGQLDSLEREEVFAPVDVSAEFPGGLGKFYKYVEKNMKFKDIFEKQGIKGNVMVEFVVTNDGSIDKETVKTVKGINKLADDEAVRLIKNSPNWVPPQQNGKAVKQRLVVPIKFG